MHAAVQKLQLVAMHDAIQLRDRPLRVKTATARRKCEMSREIG